MLCRTAFKGGFERINAGPMADANLKWMSRQRFRQAISQTPNLSSIHRLAIGFCALGHPYGNFLA